jgi:hypothetical protein
MGADLYWETLDAARWCPHKSGKTMICGHSAQRSGRPLVLDRAICIDTWVYGDGWLTCLDTQLEVYWQANERGETRGEFFQIARRPDAEAEVAVLEVQPPPRWRRRSLSAARLNFLDWNAILRV